MIHKGGQGEMYAGKNSVGMGLSAGWLDEGKHGSGEVHVSTGEGKVDISPSFILQWKLTSVG